VRTFELSEPPTLVEEVRVDGDVQSLFLLGQQAWVEVAHYEAKPLRQAGAPAPSSPTPATPVAVAMTTTATPSAAPMVAAPAKTPNPDDSIFGPPRQGGVFIFEAGLHAMVPIGTLGVGAVVDASLTWHAEIPFALRARLFPLAGVTASSTSPLTGAASGGVAAGSLDAIFDSRYFGAGLGIGFGTFKDFFIVTNTGVVTTRDSAGFLVSQHLRIGTLDGLNFTAQTQLVATESTGFTIYGGEGLLQIPVRRDWQLRFRGGGSRAPFAYGDLGMRIGIGTEDKPRLFLTPTVGVTYVNSFIGPSVGLAIDYRL
jgi:hypothetical protein